MPREMKEHCTMCGILKTEENTYPRNNKSNSDKKYLQHICKKCSKLVSAQRYLTTLPPDRQMALLEKQHAKKSIPE